jgi:hypothetical protein
MAADSEPNELLVTEAAPGANVRTPRRTPRVLMLLFALFLLLLGEIALTGTAAPVNASYPHSLRAVIGEGCGGG